MVDLRNSELQEDLTAIPSAEQTEVAKTFRFALTDEIILGILFFCAGTSPNWYTVTHVCRRWRMLALSCHYLWATLHLPKHNSVEYFRIFVNRALPRWWGPPLHIYAREGMLREQIPKDLFPWMTSHLYLTEYLAFHITPQDWPAIVHYLTKGKPIAPDPLIDKRGRMDAPILFTLDARGVSQWVAWVYAPKLRWLRVNYFPALWRILPGMLLLQDLIVLEPLVQEVTTLHEGQTGTTTVEVFGQTKAAEPAAKPMFAQVLSGLRPLVNLTQLWFHCEFDMSSDNPGMLKLPRLQILKLTGSFECCMLFLVALDVPKTTSIDLVRMSQQWPTTPEAIESLRANLGWLCWGIRAPMEEPERPRDTITPYEELDYPSAYILRLGFKPNGKILLTFFTADSPTAAPTNRLDLECRLTQLSALSSLPGLRNIRHVVIADMKSLLSCSDALQEMLGRMELLRIAFIECDLFCAASLLAPPKRTQPSPLPLLRQVRYIRMPLVHVETLTIALGHRKRHFGEKLNVLALENCGSVDENHVSTLNDLVEHLVIC